MIQDLPPETVAVTFAKTSRSPEPFDEIAAGLTDQKSSKFHERWVVGYGHSSVAEHAILHIAIEDISIVAAKAVEENRLSSFTEKSTRYQIYEPERYYHPPALMASPLGETYREAMQKLMRNYIEGMEQTIAWHREHLPRRENEKDKAFAGRCRARSCDIMRFFLPAGTLTNLGWTVNARILEYGISKFLISPFAEIREMGEQIKQTAITHVPTLVKYANPNEYLSSCGIERSKLPPGLPEERHVAEDGVGSNEVRLVDYDPDGENKIVAALAYRSADCGYEQLLSHIRGLSEAEKDELARQAIGSPRSFDPAPSALENTSYTFEITCDYGAWRDIQRHRMCTQLARELSPLLGYVEPEILAEVGLSERYRRMRELSAETYHRLQGEFPAEAVYSLLLGYRIRTLFHINLREAFHFARLRSAPQGHISYRRIAVQLWDQITQAHPLITRHLPGVYPLEAVSADR